MDDTTRQTTPSPWLPSPVPSDRDLLPGDLPFTAWDQYAAGLFDLRVFEQAVWWVDWNRSPHLIVEMPSNYVANVVGHLEENAARFHVGTMRKLLLEAVIDLTRERVPEEYLAIAVGAPSLSVLEPQVWLESTPLMRSLRRELTRRPPDEPEPPEPP